MSAAIDEKLGSRDLGGQMSFLEHLDEFRRRLTHSIIAVMVAFMVCYYFSGQIYNFLAAPAQQALMESSRRAFPLTDGLTGNEKILSLDNLQEGDAGRFVFNFATNLDRISIPPGTTINTQFVRDKDGKLGLFTTEQLLTGNAIIPAGVRIPLEFTQTDGGYNADSRMIVTTAIEPFTLYMTVSLYAAIALAVPFLLFQIWTFISPGLYPHERRYAIPFIGLSSIAFVGGAAFAYYILFPPAVRYLFGIGSDFTIMLKATDYFEFVTLIMLAMGIVFQMPAVTYVLARIGLVTAGFLISVWRTALIIILIVAAVVSPTADVLNLMLFASPMIVLYILSIFIAWVFGQKRQPDGV